MKFLIVRTDRLGDSILTLPIASKLKQKFPESKVYFLGNSYTEPLVSSSKYIDKVFSIDKFSLFQLVENLRNEKIDYAIIARPTLYNAFVLFFSGIKYRIGTKYRIYSFLFNKRIAHHRKESTKHEALYNLDLLEPLDIKSDEDLFSLDFGISPDEQIQESIKVKLRKLGVDISKPIVVFHISSGGSAIDWNYLKFKELALLLKKNLDVEILLTGTEKDFLFLYELFNESGYKIYNLAGELNLIQLFNLLSLVDVYVGNSTGPTHLAAIAGCWVVAFYPKIKVASQVRWGPITKKRIIFEPQIECSNCTKEQCKRLNCMDSIDVNKVYFEIDKILKRIKR